MQRSVERNTRSWRPRFPTPASLTSWLARNPNAAHKTIGKYSRGNLDPFPLVHAPRSGFEPQFLMVGHSFSQSPIIQQCSPIIHTGIYSKDTEGDCFLHDDAAVVTAIVWSCIKITVYIIRNATTYMFVLPIPNAPPRIHYSGNRFCAAPIMNGEYRLLTTTTGNLEVGVALVEVTTFNVRPMSPILLQPCTCGGCSKL